MRPSGKIFFASDFHLGLNTGRDPAEREKKIVRWLDFAASEAAEIYLLGDVFDFWWEYKLVVPRGFTRFLGAVSSITDSGIPVHFFTGNHDMWVGNYLSDECGMIIHKSPYNAEFDGRKFHMAHGEGLGSDNIGYKILLGIFHNRPLRILYSSMHPRIGMGIGHKWSMNSRLGKGIKLDFLGEEKEDLIRYSRSVIKDYSDIEFFIYGHRHLAYEYILKEGARVTFLGDWVREGSYAVWDGKDLTLIKHMSL